MSAEPQQAAQQVWPESYELGERVAASILRFKSGVYDGFAAQYHYDEEALTDALAVEYGKLLLDTWLDDYRAALKGGA